MSKNLILWDPEELNNLELAQIIANCQNKDLKYEMVDFHSSRPGHDLRYFTFW